MKYAKFNFTPPDQEALETYLHRVSDECLIRQRILLERGAFRIDASICPEGLPLEAVLYLGDGASLQVRDGLAPYVHLTLPDAYVSSLIEASSGPRSLYWSSDVPPLDLKAPSQNPHGYGDVTLYVEERLLERYAADMASWGGDYPIRYGLEVWDGYGSSEGLLRELTYSRDEVEAVLQPPHYAWLGRSLAELGLSDAANVEAWDVLDAAFPQDPHLWNCGKYLLRLGRKGGEEKRLEDLRKARQYLDRAIGRLEVVNRPS